MKYIVPVDGIVWRNDSWDDALAKRGRGVIFINYWKNMPESARPKFGQMITCEIPSMLGSDESAGLLSHKYRVLSAHKDELLRLIEEEGVIILSDMNAESFYPLKILQSIDGFSEKLHLIGITPLTFMGSVRKRNYHDILGSLERTKSTAIVNSDEFLEMFDRRTLTLPKFLEECARLLCDILYCLESSEMAMEQGTFYQFDLKRKAYIETQASLFPFDEKHLMGISPEISESKGMRTAIPAESNRENGKAVCKKLKEARKELARVNGIPFESPECTSIEDCRGTCEACDAELEYLNQEMEKIPQELRKYPELLKARDMPEDDEDRK